MKNLFLHFNLGFSYYSNAPVKELIFDRLPATLSLVLGGAVVWVVAGLGVGIVSARRAGSRLDRAEHGHGARARLGARILARPDRRCTCSRRTSGRSAIFPGAGSYVGLTSDPSKWFTSLILPWLVVAAGTARDLRAADARQPDRDDGRGLHPHGARQGPVRAPRRAAPRPALGDQPDRHDPRPRHRRPARQLGARRNGLQHPRHRPPRTTSRSRTPTSRSSQGTVLLAALFIIVANIIVDIAYAYPRSAGAVLMSAAQSRCCASRICASSSRPKTASCTRSTGSPTRSHRGTHAGDRRRVGLGQDRLLADDARADAHARARASPGGSCSRAATWSRSPKTSCARSAATTSR